MKPLVAASIILLGLACDRAAKDPPLQPAPAAPPPAAAKIPVLGVSTEELYSAYRENEVSADIKYKNKMVVIEDARIDSISKDFTDTPFLLLRSGHPFETFRVYFDKRFMNQAAGLKAGQRAYVAGRVRGLFLGAVTLDEGQIVKGD